MNMTCLPYQPTKVSLIHPNRQHHDAYIACRNITAPLVKLIIDEADMHAPEAKAAQTRAKNRTRNFYGQQQARAAAELKAKLPSRLRKLSTYQRKELQVGYPSYPWFCPAQGSFRDALCLRYGWQPKHISTHCVCDGKFNVEHAFSCPRGGFPSIRCNEIQDITANLMREVCHAVGTEPCLQPVTGEHLTHRPANR